MIEAYLHPPIHKDGVPYTGRYAVTFNGETVVSGSRDPETDLARALLARVEREAREFAQDQGGLERATSQGS